MVADALRALAGIALFLLGMGMLTDGLRAVGGTALKRALARLTASPWSGALVGAAATAVLQSSSAVTVTAVGFVGAGLLGFPQALGLILGANIGTTMTGWLVTLIGLKLQIGAMAGPAALAGALLRLFGRGRRREAGWALAGFGLVFLGIDALQAGLSGFEGRVAPADFPGDGLAGRLALVGIGAVLTVLTQSSSAGVATALVALSTGAIALPQAAALVIGMDVGTTASALLATVGGSPAMRRTGLAHVVFNLMSGALAFALLTPWAALAAPLAAAGTPDTLLLVGFHTGFNLLSVLLVLPFARPFAALLERLVPDRETAAGARLRPALLAEPPAAMAAALAVLDDLAARSAGLCRAALDPRGAPAGLAAGTAALAEDLAVVRGFLERIGPRGDAADRSARVKALHAIDHLGRMVRRLRQTERPPAIAADPALARIARFLRATLARPRTARSLARACAAVDRARRAFRIAAVEAAGAGATDGERTLAALDGARWLHRAAYHQWRAVHHLSRAAAA